MSVENQEKQPTGPAQKVSTELYISPKRDSIEETLNHETKMRSVNFCRDSYHAIYGEPGEFPAMEY